MSLVQFEAYPSDDVVKQELPVRPATERQPSLQRRQLVWRAVALLRQHVSEPPTIAHLSRATGVSDRTLRAAFHDVVGLSPKQYAIGQRLRAAHEALLTADPKTTTVTDIATAHGFFELGQFAGRYREVFGEVPSRTLQHPILRRPTEAARGGATFQPATVTAR